MPTVEVWILVPLTLPGSINQINQLKEKVTGFVKVIPLTEHGIRFSEPIISFISKENSDELIKKWFVEKFDILKEFIEASPELGWNLKK